MASSEGKTYLASGNISPATFVKLTSTGDFTVAQAVLSSDQLYGIAQQWTHDPPGISGSTAFAATTGQQLTVYHVGDVCLLVAGSAGFNSGDLLTSNAAGAGVTAVAGQKFGARALQTTPAAGWGRVEVSLGTA